VIKKGFKVESRVLFGKDQEAQATFQIKAVEVMIEQKQQS